MFNQYYVHTSDYLLKIVLVSSFLSCDLQEIPKSRGLGKSMPRAATGNPGRHVISLRYHCYLGLVYATGGNYKSWPPGYWQLLAGLG